MKELQGRRDFLKKMGLMAGLMQLPFSGWSAGFLTMLKEGVNPSGEFSLLKLETLLSGYKFSFIDKFSTTKFKNDYQLYNTIESRSIFAGEFSLKSTLDNESRQFEILSWRSANAGEKQKDRRFQYIISGDVKCKNNLMLTPEKWEVTSRIANDQGGKAYGGTAFLNRGEVIQQEIKILTPGKSIKKTFGPNALSWKWGLLAVVQRMAEESKSELQFALLDEFDSIYQNQVIKFRRKVKLDCGNERQIDFKVFELTGEGVIPTVYWVDNLNRTVFIVSGQEAYVLKPS